MIEMVYWGGVADNITCNDNIVSTIANSVYQGAKSNTSKTSGKWYFEYRILSSTVNLDSHGVGIHQNYSPMYGDLRYGGKVEEYAYLSNGNKMNNYVSLSYGTSFTIGDYIGIALDMDNKKITFFKNGVNQGLAFTFANITEAVIGFRNYSGNTSTEFNLGKNTFSIVSQNLSEWESLLSQGYQPYDADSAAWLVSYKSLIKSNNQLYSLDQDYNFIPVASPTLENFQTYGLDSLNGLATPKTKMNYKMNQLGDGISSKTIIPEKWWRNIQGLEVK